MPDLPSIASLEDLLLSKKAFFIVYTVFLGLIILVSVVLFYHWAKYAKETDMKYRLMQLIYVVGMIFFVLVAFMFYMLI